MAQPAIFDVIVEHPRDDVNEYTYDESTHLVRLAGVVRVDTPAFADGGLIAGSATPLGEPLRAWLLSDLPLSPNTVVTAHAVGALEYATRELTERIVVAVPVADTHYARAHAFNDLPAPHRAALQRLIEESARWLDAASAEELVHLARQRGRLAQSERREHPRERAAWQAGSEYSFVEHLARETTLHTQAEAALFTVPFRFQDYLRLCLEMNERIIFWVQRPRFAINNRITGLGGKTRRDGLLVITDQQCLWMMDPLTPTGSLEGGYGYIARTIPLEWIAEAAVEEGSNYLALKIISANTRGNSSAFEIEFPLSARDDLAQVQRLLCAFTPRSDTRHLRRIAFPAPFKPVLDDPMEHDHAETQTVVTEMQAALSTQLNGETILAQTFLPLWSDGGARLLTVTPRRLGLVVPRGHAKDYAYLWIPIHSMIASEICFSILGSWFRVESANAKPLEIRFPPLSHKGINLCWRMLRQLWINVEPTSL